MYFSCSSQDCTIKMWETTQRKLIRELKVIFLLFIVLLHQYQMHSSSALLPLNMFWLVALSDSILTTSVLLCLITLGAWTLGKLLALSTEYVLRTGAFDHTGRQYPPNEEMKKVKRLTPLHTWGQFLPFHRDSDLSLSLWKICYRRSKGTTKQKGIPLKD